MPEKLKILYKIIMEFKYIINPKTHRKVSILSKKGKKLLLKYNPTGNKFFFNFLLNNYN